MVQREGPVWDRLSLDQQERLVTEHLTYEVRMLVVGARLLAHEEASRDECRLALEAFLVHARLLHEFLTTSNGKTDDVRAHHYAPAWPDVVPPVSRKLAEDHTYEALHKWLAHLTTRRLDVEVERSWPVQALGDDLARRLATWVEAVPDDRRPWLAKIEQHLAKWWVLSPRLGRASDVVMSTASDHAPPQTIHVLRYETN